MSRGKKRADRIRAEIPIQRVLADYGYNIDGGYDGEQQFSCDLHGDGRDNKPSGRVYPSSGSWYCVAVDERVLTSDGWTTLRDLGFYGLRDPVTGHARQVLDGTAEWSHVVAYLPKGEKATIRVQTKAGYAVTVTSDHEVEVVGKGWVPAGTIRPGDVLVVPRPRQPRFGPDCGLPVQDLNERDYGHHPRLCLPSRWSVELGEALGYVFGDGWVVPRQSPASGTVGLTTHSDDVEDARAVFRHMQHWASGRGSEAHRTDITTVNDKEYVQDQYVFTIGNDGFCEFFSRLGVTKNEPPIQRRLPEGIWHAPECGVRGFLRGIYGTDGSVFRPKGRKGIKVNLYSVSGPFLRDVQLLLLQFGVYSRLYPPSKTRVKSGKREGRLTHPCWYLQLATGEDILTFRHRIGIANRRKQAVLDSYKHNPRGARPFKPVVESITSVGTVPVADLSLPVEHSFVAGGIKVHNCFACDRSRDAIETTREKEGLDFQGALKLLESRYHLPPLPWDDDDRQEAQDRKQHNNTVAAVGELLDPARTIEQDQRAVERLLFGATVDRDLPMLDVIKFWEAFDKIHYMLDQRRIDEQAARQGLRRVHDLVMAKYREKA